jgi:hypothetical protein
MVEQLTTNVTTKRLANFMLLDMMQTVILVYELAATVITSVWPHVVM